MENKLRLKNRKTVRREILRGTGVFGGILAVLALLFHRAVYAVFWNLITLQLKVKEPDTWENGTAFLDVPYSGISKSDYVDIYVPSDVEHPPLFVLVHGGGFIANDSRCRQAQLMYRYFRDHGYACASVNYRLAQEAGFPGAVEDVKAAIRFLRANADTYGYNAERIAVWGESAGGYLACAAAFTNDEEFCGLPYTGEDSAAEKVSAQVQVLVDFYGLAELKEDDSDWKKLGIPLIVNRIGNFWLDAEIPGKYKNISDFWLRGNMKEMSGQEKEASDLSYYIRENLTAQSDLAVYISHGKCDITVPILQSERLREKLSKIPGDVKADEAKPHIRMPEPTCRRGLAREQYKLYGDKVMWNAVERAGHASDRLYTDKELEKVKAFLDANLQ